MPIAKGQTGFQPPARDAERRAFFDLLRRIKALEDGGGGGGPGPGGEDEVFIGPGDPGSSFELWVDTDAIPGGGGGMALSYVHNQGTPAETWVIDHNLNMYPNVVVEDSGGTTVEGEIVYNSAHQVTLTFSAAFSGVAYLS